MKVDGNFDLRMIPDSPRHEAFSSVLVPFLEAPLCAEVFRYFTVSNGRCWWFLLKTTACYMRLKDGRRIETGADLISWSLVAGWFFSNSGSTVTATVDRVIGTH